MQYVIIKYRAPSINNGHMPLFLYTTPLLVLEEKENTVKVQYNNSEFYTYEFDKKYIERYLQPTPFWGWLFLRFKKKLKKLSNKKRKIEIFLVYIIGGVFFNGLRLSRKRSVRNKFVFADNSTLRQQRIRCIRSTVFASKADNLYCYIADFLTKETLKGRNQQSSLFI